MAYWRRTPPTKPKRLWKGSTPLSWKIKYRPRLLEIRSKHGLKHETVWQAILVIVSKDPRTRPRRAPWYYRPLPPNEDFYCLPNWRLASKKRSVKVKRIKKSLGLWKATAYSPNEGSIGGGPRTALGHRAGNGHVAVDPAFWPLSIRLYVQGYGFACACDTGSAVKGRNRVDVGFTDVSKMHRWGTRRVRVYKQGVKRYVWYRIILKSVW